MVARRPARRLRTRRTRCWPGCQRGARTGRSAPLQLEAIAACCAPDAIAKADAGARRLAALRADMVDALSGLGLDVIAGDAPFVLFSVPDSSLP